MLGHKEHLGGSYGNRGPRAKLTPPKESRDPGVGHTSPTPHNTSAGKSEDLHQRFQCLWAPQSMWALHNCDLMVKWLAEGWAVLIPAAPCSRGGHFPVM